MFIAKWLDVHRHWYPPNPYTYLYIFMPKILFEIINKHENEQKRELRGQTTFN